MVGRTRKIGRRQPNGQLARLVEREDTTLRDLDRFMDEPTAIYVTEAGSMSKIGISNNPSRRAREFQTSNGQTVRMVWYRWLNGPDAKKLERAIHKQYRGTNAHAHGEWYYLSTASAIDLVTRKIEELKLFSIWERYSAFVERPWNDVTRDRAPNPFGEHA